MSVYNFKVSISPVEALELIKQNENADLVHEETHDLGKEICIETLVFEKYFMRVARPDRMGRDSYPQLPR